MWRKKNDRPPAARILTSPHRKGCLHALFPGRPRRLSGPAADRPAGDAAVLRHAVELHRPV
ncbi:MAG: hypothetical protein CVU25_06650, partial [Betaproteobacteria bacterium HGW-Betaproteobacteria-19]